MQDSGITWDLSMCSMFQLRDDFVLLAYLPSNCKKELYAEIRDSIEAIPAEIRRGLSIQVRLHIFRSHQDFRFIWPRRFPPLSKQEAFINRVDVSIHDGINPAFLLRIVLGFCSTLESLPTQDALDDNRKRYTSCGYEITRSMLWSCCLLNKQWYRFVAPLLYREIILDNIRTSQLLVRTLRQSPKYAEWIHRLDFLMPSFNYFLGLSRKSVPNLSSVTLWVDYHTFLHTIDLLKYVANRQMIVNLESIPSEPLRLSRILSIISHAYVREINGNIIPTEKEGE